MPRSSADRRVTALLCAFGALAVLGTSTNARAGEAVTATGRCLWEDKAGKRTAIPGTRVELWDSVGVAKESDWVKGCIHGVGNACVGQAETDAQGKFTIKGELRTMLTSSAKVIEGGKNLYVRCWLRNGHAIFLSAATKVPTPYEVVAPVKLGAKGAIAAGDLVFKATAGDAGRMFTVLERVTKRMQTAGIGKDLLPVLVLHPSGTQTSGGDPKVPSYAASYAELNMVHYIEGRPDHTVAHEFGHTTQFMYFASLSGGKLTGELKRLADAMVAQHGKVGGGHEYWSNTNPQFAWTEGWGHFTALYGMSPVFDGRCGADWTKHEVGPESERVKIEGNIGCRLYDLSKKVGYKKIWDTAKVSKAPDFPTFLKALGQPWTNPHP